MYQLEMEPQPRQINLKEYKKRLALTKRGYCIIKKEITPEILQDIKKNLIVKPNINFNYEQDVKPFPVYLEGQTKLYLPKFYGFKHFGYPNKNKMNRGYSINLSFQGQLRENQEPVVERFLKSCQLDKLDSPDYTKSNGGIISVGCGFGKTVLALYLVYRLKVKTLVIVHKEFLMNQWKDRINQYLPNARIGFIQGSKVDIEDKDIIIAMLQSVSMKEYETNVFEDFGFCIIDECHHIGAEVFSRSLPIINSWYMLGLSATPKRKDGLSKVFEWYIGPYIYRETKKRLRKVEIRMIYYDSNNPLYNKVELTIKQKPSVPKMITNVSLCQNRNHLITQLLIEICRDINRKVLVLGERRDQLFELSIRLKKEGMENVGYYIGGMKENELKKSETCQIMLATFSMSSEGMDVPALNTLFMISSKADIEQSVGRILRREDVENIPTVYDLVDNFSVFGNQSRKRLKFYQKNKYDIYTSQARDYETDMTDLVKSALHFHKQETQEKPVYKKGECIL